MIKLITMKNVEPTYKVNTYHSLPYTYTKCMELFELYSKEKADFFVELLFIKVSCVVNVSKICGLLRNG